MYRSFRCVSRYLSAAVPAVARSASAVPSAPVAHHHEQRERRRDSNGQTRSPCAAPVPDAVARGGPVVVDQPGRDPDRVDARADRRVHLRRGPAPVWTPRILDLLRRNNARATFFVHGAQAARHPELVRRIRAEVHEIGSNTYTGAVLGESSAPRFRAELEMTQSALAGATGRRTNLLRMPKTTSPDTLGASGRPRGGPPGTGTCSSPPTRGPGSPRKASSGSSARRRARIRRRAGC
ncbi:polysaccharide deacetylase family protein [Streptomyces massasporeus]|uniref:polysaccharide deacetylase family protein n=1 Tax=Streptomyces massasporeus TaxID=67324 RepID=UPI0036FAA29B